MSDIQIPHFSLPFRIHNGSAVVVEQDSTDEILDCVQAICSYPAGSRPEQPDFGIPDQTFRQGGVDTDAIAAAVDQWEPRAHAVASADNSSLADLISQVAVATKETT
jgi:phage baseplate assembly protein W